MNLDKRIIMIGAIAAAVMSTITAWNYLGFPTLAWSMEIKTLTRNQAIIAEQTYTNTIMRYLLLPPQADPALKLFVEDELRKATMEQQRAVDRKIKLSN